VPNSRSRSSRPSAIRTSSRERLSRSDARSSNTWSRPADIRWTSSASSPVNSTTGIFPIRRTRSIRCPASASSGGANVFIVTMPGASADSTIVPASAASRRRVAISTSGSSGTRPSLRRGYPAPMRIAVSSDERIGVAEAVVEELKRRGHEPVVHGALADGERPDWAWASEAAARDVADGRAEQGIVCCWTGTGASIAANKVDGVRAALCGDAETARGARRWNDANVLALSLRATSEALLEEILDAWFEGRPSTENDDAANIRHVDEIA
jgi:ribose 5-phosphate isomerase B